jgi:hypothetical protein
VELSFTKNEQKQHPTISIQISTWRKERLGPTTTKMGRPRTPPGAITEQVFKDLSRTSSWWWWGALWSSPVVLRIFICTFIYCSILNYVVSSAVLVMSVVGFWVLTPCELVGGYQWFGKTYCLHKNVQIQSGNWIIHTWIIYRMSQKDVCTQG